MKLAVRPFACSSKALYTLGAAAQSHQHYQTSSSLCSQFSSVDGAGWPPLLYVFTGLCSTKHLYCRLFSAFLQMVKSCRHSCLGKVLLCHSRKQFSNV